MLKGTLMFVGGMVLGVFGCYAAKKSWYSKAFTFMASQSKKLEMAVRKA